MLESFDASKLYISDKKTAVAFTQCNIFYSNLVASKMYLYNMGVAKKVVPKLDSHSTPSTYEAAALLHELLRKWQCS